ncbi:MAG: hypothetical protein K2L45_11855 [Muribaculaceae bacterium]|nr:hypothetical protein [Muribaculaceae bacterium]
MLDRLRIPISNLDNSESENSSLSEYLTLYCMCLIVGLLIGLYGFFQNQYLPSHTKWIASFTYILPAYSLVGVVLRFRDAKATTIVSLSILLLTDTTNSIYIFVKDGGISLQFVMEIILCLMWVCWIVYFIKSKSVELYFPKHARKINNFDGRFLIVFVGFCLALNLTMISYIKNLNFNMKAYQEIVGKSSQIRGFNDSQIKYWDCTIEGDVCNVYFIHNDKFISQNAFYQNLDRPYFSDELLYTVIAAAPDFIRSIIDHNLALVFNVFYKDISDRRVFNISYEQINNLKDLEPQEALTPVEMQKIRESLLEILPSKINKNITLVSLEWLNEINLIAVYEVDENREKYIDVFDDFKTQAEDFDNLLKKKIEESNQAVLFMWHKEVALKFILRGSKTGYEEAIIIISKE